MSQHIDIFNTVIIQQRLLMNRVITYVQGDIKSKFPAKQSFPEEFRKNYYRKNL